MSYDLVLYALEFIGTDFSSSLFFQILLFFTIGFSFGLILFSVLNLRYFRLPGPTHLF